MKVKWKIVAAIAAVGLVVGAPIGGHYRAKWALETYRRHLIQIGEKLTIEEIAPRSTESERIAARDYAAATRRFGAAPTYTIPTMRTLNPGHVLWSTAEEVLPTEESSNIWPVLKGDVQRHEQDFIALRAALEAPAFNFNLNYNQGFSLLLPDLSPAKVSALWCAAAAMDDLHDRRLADALQDLKAGAAATRTLAHEPLIISQLVRIAMGAVAMGPAWEALQASGWQDEQLKQLQDVWASIDFLDGVEGGMAMDRAMGRQSYEAARTSFDTYSTYSASNGGSALDALGQALANPKAGYDALMGRYPRYYLWKWQWSYDEERCNMIVQQTGVEWVRAARSNAGFVPASKKFDDAIAKLRQLHPNIEGRFVLGLNDGLIRGYIVKMANVEVERRLLVAAIALKRYQLREGKYPAQLLDLKPNYLANTPIDLMDGKPLRYKLKPDGAFLLYSIGEDGEDNGGDPTPTQGDEVRYKSWLKGRDAVWPAPAGVEEIKMYKEQAIAKWSLLMPRLPARGSKGRPPVPIPAPASPGTNTP